MKQTLHHYWQSFSFVGLVVAALFFAASLTPSLLPRHFAVQGILSGFSLAIGYFVGVAGTSLWLFLELPQPRASLERWSVRVTTVAVAIVMIVFTWRATAWQNSIRSLMEMPPVQSAEPIYFFAIAIVTACVLITTTRKFIVLGVWIANQLKRFVPPRVAGLTSTIVVLTLIVLIANGVIARGLLSAADQFFSAADELIDEGIERPTRDNATGSAESLVEWESIGRQGKDFIATGPTSKLIRELTGQTAIEPLRVYVGYRTCETIGDRAALALEELKRVGGFDRSVLVVAVPTGTGWLDPGAVDTVEVLHGGDIATVSIQYSYLPSWITILVDPTQAKVAGQALFDAIYPYWKTLPKQSRPKLYIHGLSLGAYGSEDAADLLTIFEDPIQGAVWSGAPFPSRQWASIVRNRNPGTPPWMPTYRDSALVRFTSQQNHLDTGQRWGPIRDVYIQHASDPMVWFSPNLAWHRPDWLGEPRGPDVSPQLRWYPIVTFLQVAFDLPMATAVPVGYGHNYGPSSYIDAWVAVTEPEGWDAKKIAKLKADLEPE